MTSSGGIWLCTFAVFVGLLLTFQDRLTEFTITGIGSMKATVEKAKSDAEEVEAIRKRIETQSATVDLIAKEASEAKELVEDVSRKNQDAAKKLETLDASIEKGNRAVSELQAISEFSSTVIEAQNDDRRSFDHLQEWSRDTSYPFRDKAQKAWEKIFSDHSSPMYVSGFEVPWVEGVDPSSLTLSDLAKDFVTAPTQVRVALLEFIWKREDLPKVQRLDFLIEVMQKDASLKVCEYAGRYFTQTTDQKIKPLAVEYLSEWWKTHRSEFVEDNNHSSTQPAEPAPPLKQGTGFPN